MTRIHNAAVAGARLLLASLNVELDSEHFKDTPERVARSLRDLVTRQELKFTTFDNDGIDEMVICRNVPFYSLCAHHLLPFFGKAHVAYIPKDKLVGISKLARTVEYYARAFQIQEVLTKEIADRVENELHPLGVAVVLEAEHLCMTMRGAQKPGSLTTTSAMRGVFLNPEKHAREEFLRLIKEK